jgi:DDE superfamily endonuclease
MTKEVYKQGRIHNAQYNGNGEFISLLAYICADGTTIAPALIYQGTSNDLHNTWIENLNERDKAYFTALANRWTNNELGLAWLRRFHQDIKHKGSRRRLLILDGYLSHINIAFLSLIDSL